MQTVTPIQPGASAVGAKDQPDTAGEGGAFPATLQQALARADGKASPPPAGKSSPPPEQTSTGPANPTALESAAASAALPSDAAPTQPLDLTLPATSATTPIEPTRDTGAPVPAEVPGIAAALQDIAAGRRAANHPDTAPMRPDTPADVAEPPLSHPVDVAAAHAEQRVPARHPEEEPVPDATATQGLLTNAPGLRPIAPPAPQITTDGKAGAPEAATASVPAFGSNSPPTPSTADVAALGTAALVAPAGSALPPPAPTTVPADPGARALPELNIAAPPGSPQFGPELGERLLWLVRDGLHEARLQLNPRELGPVEVRLSVGDGAAQLSFTAQHAGTVAAVQQSLPQLRDMLAQQGLQLGQANVFHQPAGDGAAGEQQTRGSGNQPGWDGRHGGEVEDSLPAPSARVIGRGLVDAYA